MQEEKIILVDENIKLLNKDLTEENSYMFFVFTTKVSNNKQLGILN